MLNKEVSKTYQIQIREWREIQNILFMIWPILSLHADAMQMHNKIFEFFG